MMTIFAQTRRLSLGFRYRCLLAFAVLLSALLSGIAMAQVQAPIFDWEGTVEVEVFVDGKWQSSTTVTLKAMAGERKKYRLRLTEPLPMNEKGWWVRIHVGLQPDGSDGVVYSAGDYPPNDAAISWIPSVGWPFDPGDWESGQCKGQGPFQCESKWREVSITAHKDLETPIRFMHDVLDAQSECPPALKGLGELFVSIGTVPPPPPPPSAVTVSVASATAMEGDAVSFPVTLSGAAESDTVLGWTTAAGTATSGTDYTAVTAGTLTIAAEATTGMLTVATAEDMLAEGDETFTVTITGTTLPAGVTLGRVTATGTIEDDETLTAAVMADAETVVEGNTASFTVALTGGTSTAAVEVSYTVSGTATAGTDYTAPSGTLTLDAGASSGTITIPTLTDIVLDGGETLVVTLTGASTSKGTVTVNTTAAETTIADTGTVTVSVADATAAEGDELSFTVTRSGTAGSDTVLGWTTAAGTATSGTDYTAVTAGTLTIAAEATTGTLTVATVEDTLAEGDETFTVTITGTTLPSGVTLGRVTATGTIEDDENGNGGNGGNDGDGNTLVDNGGTGDTGDGDTGDGGDGGKDGDGGTGETGDGSTGDGGQTSMPSSDATLKSLVLSRGTKIVPLAPRFTPGTTMYRTEVDSAVTQVTVMPRPNHSGATIAYQYGDDKELKFLNDIDKGFQVELAMDTTVITVKVTAEDRTMMQIYMVTVTRVEGLALRRGGFSHPWLARFARTVGTQVVNVVGERFVAPRQPGLAGQVAGQDLSRLVRASVQQDDAPETRVRPRAGLAEYAPGRSNSRILTGRDFLSGTAFTLTMGQEDGLSAALWGRGAIMRFDGRDGDLLLDGEVSTGMLGVDYVRGAVTGGLLVGLNRGEGDYQSPTGEGELDSLLVGVYPYARVEISERISAWGLFGHGRGNVTLSPDSQSPISTDIGLHMGALGVEGMLSDSSGPTGLGLTVKSDAMWVKIESDEAVGLDSTHAKVSRLRLMLEGVRVFEVAPGATLTPSGQIGLRHDDGDAETGFGLDINAGIRYAAGRLTIEGTVRTLVAHEDSAYEEWGASGAIRMTPDALGRGLSLTLAPAWGNTASKAEQLWAGQAPTGLATTGSTLPGARLTAELGYGMVPANQRGILTPYAGLSLGDGSSQSYRTGARWQMAPETTLALEASHAMAALSPAPVNSVMLRAAWRW